MDLTLSNNIRSLRKQRRLTQEQLAEVVGVTAGAVYKWESGISYPELCVIVELADFFDVSVDALLGYRMKDNSESAVINRLNEYCRSRAPGALIEAEKALKKYPNSFEVVHTCSALFLIYGAEAHDKDALYRALELMEQARCLISQNSDPEISELTLYRGIASVYGFLGEAEKSLEILRKNNANGIFNDSIGISLAVFMGRPDEAEPYLQKALMTIAGTLVNTVVGYAFVFISRGDCHSALDILTCGFSFLQGIKKETDKPDFLDKIYAELYIFLSHVQRETGQLGDAERSFENAVRFAARFDAALDYGLTSFRYGTLSENVSLFDSFGATAAEGIESVIRLLDDRELSARWKEAVKNGGK